MTKIEKYDRAGNRLDDDEQVEDGVTLRVPVLMMDSLAPADIIAATRRALADAPLVSHAGHRPGGLVLDGIWPELDAIRREVQLDLRKQQLSDAWRNPPAINPAEAAKPAAIQTDADLEAFHDRRLARLADCWRGAAA